MAIGGGQAIPYIGKQSAAGTIATTVYKSLSLEAEHDSGRQVDEGVAEVGGGLFTASNPTVLGINPFISGRARLRLGTFPFYLNAAGFAKGSTTGDGATTIYTHPFTPVSTSATWPNITWGKYYESGFSIGQRDVRLNLEVAFIPGQGVVFSYQGTSANEEDGPGSQTADPSDYVPTTAETVLAADLEFLGANTARFLSCIMSIQNAISLDQIIGSLANQNVTVNELRVRFRGEVELTEEYYKQLAWGTAAGGTGVSTTINSSSFQVQVRTPEAVVSTTKGGVDIAVTTMKYILANPVRSQAGGTVRCAFLGIPGSTPTVTVYNGYAGTNYS